MLRKKFKPDQRGVTLIELLAVIVILAIIAAVAVPVVAINIAKAKENTTQQNITLIVEAAQRYLMVNIESAGSTVPASIDVDDLVTNGYLQNKPADLTHSSAFFETVNLDTTNGTVSGIVSTDGTNNYTWAYNNTTGTWQSS